MGRNDRVSHPLLPTIRIGQHDITRLVIGGNPFSGNSHMSAERDAEFADYYTNAAIVDALFECERQGINTVQARGDRHIIRALREYRNAGGTMHFIAQTASELADLHGNVRQIAAAGAIGAYHHGSRTDSLWRAGRIDEVLPLLDTMRQSGLLVGLGTHLPEVVQYAEEHGWDIDFYLACVYTLGQRPRESAIVSGAQQEETFDDADRDVMFNTIRATPKPCFAFKILAAGRNCATAAAVREAFEIAFANIKPTDAVIVGMVQKHINQVEMNARIVREICATR